MMTDYVDSHRCAHSLYRISSLEGHDFPLLMVRYTNHRPGNRTYEPSSFLKIPGRTATRFPCVREYLGSSEYRGSGSCRSPALVFRSQRWKRGRWVSPRALLERAQRGEHEAVVLNNARSRLSTLFVLICLSHFSYLWSLVSSVFYHSLRSTYIYHSIFSLS